jgi:hypothetical protein
MATSVTFNGSTYSVPANREPRGWGTSLSAFLVDVGNNALSKAGGNFTLTADANFGATYGLVVKYIKSASSNISQSGVIRLANTDKIGFRNNANGADLSLGVSASDRLQFESVNVPTASSTDIFTNKTLTDPIITGQSSAPTYAAGKMWYDTVDNTMRYYNDSTVDSVNIGQEINVRVRNTSGSTISAGQVVRVTGATGGVPNVSLAQANTFANAKVYAVVTETITNNSTGYATISGLIKNLDLSAFTDGDVLYLSASVAGGLTATRPSAPNYAIGIGAVSSNNGSTGRLIVQLQPGRPLGFGTASQVIAMNSGGTEQEYVTTTGSGNVVRATSPTIVTPVVDDGLLLNHETTASTPASGKIVVYAKSDNKVYKKDSTGTETQLATTAEAFSNPMTTSGDIVYGGVSGAATRLAANSLATKKFLRSVSSGTPTWEEIDIVKGQTAGTAIAAGYVGEVVTFTARTVTGALGAWNVNTSALATLTAGVWLICGQFTTANASATSYVEGAIATNALADSTGIIANGSVVMSSIATASNSWAVGMRVVVLNVGSSQAIYGKSFSEDAAQNVTVQGIAVRIA